MTYGENGSVIGPQNLPTSSAAPGVWSLGEIAEAERDGIWPAPASGYVMVVGLPDTAGTDFYPYNIQLLNNGTTARLGGRWNPGGGNPNGRICYMNLDLSGGAAAAPTTATVQTAWSFSISSATQEGIYAEQPGGLWVDSSDNSYETGNVYPATSASSYDYYNLGVNKYDSSGTQQWQTVYRQNTGAYSPGMQRAVVWHDETNNDCVFLCYFQDSLAGWNKRRHQMVLLDDSTGNMRSTSWNRMVYMNNENSSVNNQMGSGIKRSNVNGTKIATLHDYYDNSDKSLVSPILWDMGQPYSVSSGWTTTSVGLRNISTGGTDITGTGICLDSSNNVYVTGFFQATGITGPYTPYNVFVAKYNSTGTLQWIYCLRQQAGGESTSLMGGGIEIDGTDLYISGYSNKVGGSVSAPFLARLDVSAATPSLTWINQAANATYNCYAQAVKRVGSDQVVSWGYGQTDPGSVVGVMASMNIDGSTTGSGTVDGVAWTSIDLSPYIVFADANTSGTTANVWVVNNGSVSITEGAINNTIGGYYNTKVTGAPSPTNTVESGGIG